MREHYEQFIFTLKKNTKKKPVTEKPVKQWVSTLTNNGFLQSVTLYLWTNESSKSSNSPPSVEVLDITSIVSF